MSDAEEPLARRKNLSLADLAAIQGYLRDFQNSPVHALLMAEFTEWERQDHARLTDFSSADTAVRHAQGAYSRSSRATLVVQIMLDTIKKRLSRTQES